VDTSLGLLWEVQIHSSHRLQQTKKKIGEAIAIKSKQKKKKKKQKSNVGMIDEGRAERGRPSCQAPRSMTGARRATEKNQSV